MCRWMIIFICLTSYFTMGELYDKSHLSSDESEDEDEPPRAFFFIFAGLAVGGILRALIKVLNFPIPFRVLILFVGAIVGILSGVVESVEKYIGVAHLKPRFILMTFLPLLMFKTAFCIDAHTFMRSWGQIFFLAVPGLLISACFTGMLMMVILGHDDWTYAMGIMFGTICTPIYPVEIVAMLKEIGQAKHLSILLEGEGMIGDATVMIMVEILLGVIDEQITTWYHVLMVFCRFALGGVILGMIFGKLMGWIMGAMYNDVVNMLISTIVAAYLTYYIGVEMLSVSGVIAVVVLGIMASMEKTSLSVDVEVFLVYFWDMLAYIANTMIFLLAGVITAERLSQYTTLQDYTLVLVTYVVAGVARLMEYTLMAPIVSRIGYGLTFRNMTIAVWSGLRGPVPFCLTLNVFHHLGLSPLGRELLVHIAGLVTLTLLINATTTPLLLKLLGLSELSMARKVNMNNCMRHLQNRRDRTISMLKMDRFLADANWPLVNTATILKHPYKINLSDSEDEEENYLGYRITTCPDCQKEIPNEPTNKEMIEMTREARMRILKAKKISYARQYENGMLSKDGIRVLTQAVETAMDTEAALIELDGLHRYFKRQGFVHYTRRKLLSIFFKKSESSVKPPRKYWRRICYRIIMHPAFDIFIFCCITLNVIPIGTEIGMMPRSGTPLSTALKVANTIFFTIYLLEFLLKIYGYSWIYICKHGFRTYFGSYWNIFDFIILCVALIDLVMDYVDLFSKSFDKVEHKASRVTLVTKLIRVIRLIRLLRLCKAWYPKLIKYCDSKIDKHLAFAYDVGKGFVTGEEEVSDMLIQMIDNRIIREDCRLRMEADRLAITKELGMVQKDRPWIAITVKTRQAIRSTLNSMVEAVLELKVSGWVDDVEYAMLMESLEERLKYIRTKIKSVQPSPPKVMFKEVPWMADDEQISDFLYENVVTKVFDQGDVVCVDGEMADGIYVIVTGLFKLSYTPRKEILDSLIEFGTLPIIDYIASTRFEEKVEDYIVSGNCVGELSALTGRPYNCTITADTASQAYILTHEVIKQAIQRSPDPLNGLESKMWKTISIRLATSILMDTPAYQSSTQEKIRFQLERAFVPNLSHYKVFGVNDMMEDIILIEGVVFDYNTRDCYTAPCYIPRTVQRIVLPKSSHMDFETTIETKLLIIPARDVDEFDIMEREEEISEMVSTASVKCLQHAVQSRASRLKRKRKRQTTFSMGSHRRVKYGDSKMSATQSMYYSRSRLTNASSYETELQNITMYEQDGNALDSYVVNEKENRPSTQDRKVSKAVAASLDERRVSSRRQSKRPLKDSTNNEKAKEQQNGIKDNNKEENKQNIPEELKSTADEQKTADRDSSDESFLNKQKKMDSNLDNAERRKSDVSKKSVEKRKESNNITENKNQQSEKFNSLTEKEKYQRSSADRGNLSEQDNLQTPNNSSARKPTLTLDDLLQKQRLSNTSKKLESSDTRKQRKAPDEIEQIEIEQSSQLFNEPKEEMKYRRRSTNDSSVDKGQKLYSGNLKNEPQSEARKTSKDYRRVSSETKGEDQRKFADKSFPNRSQNTENNNTKDRRKSDDIWRRENRLPSEKIVPQEEKNYRGQLIEDPLRKQMKPEKDQRRQSSNSRSLEMKLDEQLQGQRLSSLNAEQNTESKLSDVRRMLKDYRRVSGEAKVNDEDNLSDNSFPSRSVNTENDNTKSDNNERRENRLPSEKINPDEERDYHQKSIEDSLKKQSRRDKNERQQFNDRQNAVIEVDEQSQGQRMSKLKAEQDIQSKFSETSKTSEDDVNKSAIVPQNSLIYIRRKSLNADLAQRKPAKDQQENMDLDRLIRQERKQSKLYQSSIDELSKQEFTYDEDQRKKSKDGSAKESTSDEARQFIGAKGLPPDSTDRQKKTSNSSRRMSTLLEEDTEEKQPFEK